MWQCHAWDRPEYTHGIFPVFPSDTLRLETMSRHRCILAASAQVRWCGGGLHSREVGRFMFAAALLPQGELVHPDWPNPREETAGRPDWWGSGVARLVKDRSCSQMFQPIHIIHWNSERPTWIMSDCRVAQAADSEDRGVDFVTWPMELANGFTSPMLL